MKIFAIVAPIMLTITTGDHQPGMYWYYHYGVDYDSLGSFENSADDMVAVPLALPVDYGGDGLGGYENAADALGGVPPALLDGCGPCEDCEDTICREYRAGKKGKKGKNRKLKKKKDSNSEYDACMVQCYDCCNDE